MLGAALALYVAVLFAIAIRARGRIHDAADYLVAGRRLSLPLATATLFGTWFGAGTLLATTDEVRSTGLRAAALDPLGAGACLLIAGLFFAAPLWRLQLLTLPDFFHRRFGPRAELLGAVLMVPGYFGWIAAQFVALASVLELFFGVGLGHGMLLVAVVGTGYTLIGGMWSVTLTDAFQVALLLVGLVVLVAVTLLSLGSGDAGLGLARIADETPPSLLALVPREDAGALLGWLGLLAAGSLGNLPGQDLMQRVFAARSARLASAACLVAGAAYLAFGALPPLLGLASRILLPEGERAVLPMLAALLLHPAVTTLVVLAIVSAVLSTIDSAILAPAAVLAQNVVPRAAPRLAARLAPLHWNQLAVCAVAAASLAVAWAGEDAYSLLEGAYEIGLVSLLVPLAMGLHGRRGGERAALAAMAVGTAPWLLHAALGWDWIGGPAALRLGIALPVGLSCAGLALLAYLAAGRASR